MLVLKENQCENKSINNIQFNNDGNLFYKLNLLEQTKSLHKLNFKVVLFTDKIKQLLFTDKNQRLSWHKSLAQNQ